jgi:hypothetical protein
VSTRHKNTPLTDSRLFVRGHTAVAVAVHLALHCGLVDDVTRVGAAHLVGPLRVVRNDDQRASVNKQQEKVRKTDGGLPPSNAEKASKRPNQQQQY